jgi:hypothetical protein
MVSVPQRIIPGSNRSMVASVVLVFLILVTACGNAPTRSSTVSTLTEDEQAAIYATVIRQFYNMDYKLQVSDENIQPTIIYVATQTDDSRNYPPGNVNSDQIPENIQVRVTALLSDLPVKISWYDSGWSNVTLGNIYPQPDGSVKTLGNYRYMNEMAGRGYTLEQRNGVWKLFYSGEAWLAE